MKNIILSLIITLALVGCVTDPNSPYVMIPSSEVEAQTYTYTELNGNKSELWKKARNYIATVYGDSKSVFRVEDEVDGVLLGKGVINWSMGGGTASLGVKHYCSSEYDIRFVAKDNKAQLQLKISKTILECKNWITPSRYGYAEILREFERMSKELEASLRGNGQLESMHDF
jgi:hypothetical protein